jgi:DNA-binding response OmpR family regulator
VSRIPHRILVADDDPAILRLVAVVLRRACYTVDTAVNGRDALEKLLATQYDVVVLDLMMPELTGFDVIARVAPRRAAPKFVVIMSAASPELVAQAAGANVFAALKKPFDIAELIATVDACAATAARAVS